MNISQAHAGHLRVNILVFTLAYDCCISSCICHALNSHFPYMVPGTAATASWNLLEMHMLGPTPDVWDQKLWEWSPESTVTGSSRWLQCPLKLEKHCLTPWGESTGEHSEENHYGAQHSTRALISNPAWQIRNVVQWISLSFIPNSHTGDLVRSQKLTSFYEMFYKYFNYKFLICSLNLKYQN